MKWVSSLGYTPSRTLEGDSMSGFFAVASKTDCVADLF